MQMLIIDDSRTMRRYLGTIASELDIAVSEAADGEEALAQLAKQVTELSLSFEVALVDWEMPRMNGLQFVQAVRSKSDYDQLKIVMVTSYNGLEEVRSAISAGADDFLMKPISAEMVAEKLRLLGLIE